MKHSFFIFLLIIINSPGFAQEIKTEPPFKNPRLVVGIVVDQMRYDYLTRFWHRYSDGGFKRLVGEGFNCKNTHFNYVPTYTGPGHASVYTGTSPAYHGIIANHWYDKVNNKMVYCVDDSNYKTLGAEDDSGRKSPHRLLSTTLADEIRLATSFKGKTVAVAIKDRGAVLPLGFTGNAAYWFRGKDNGFWVSSSYYQNDLPDWVKKFNKSGKAKKYKKDWKPLNKKGFVQDETLHNNYEGNFIGQSRPDFPYDLKDLWKANGQFELLKATPYGNSLTTDFALAALKGEKLGEDGFTDFLGISYSSTDYVGHRFGVYSKETEDVYLRLDAELERLLKALDNKLGKSNYTLFLSSDHGAIAAPSYLNSKKIKAGYYSTAELEKKLQKFIDFKFGKEKIIRNWSNNQIFLDHDLIFNLELDPEEVQQILATELLNYKEIANVYTRNNMLVGNLSKPFALRLQNGFNPQRSGDVVLLPHPHYIDYPQTGSTHGSGYTYDTHIPLIFYGAGIKNGSSWQKTSITDIAPTICALLGIPAPSAATGDIIEVVLD